MRTLVVGSRKSKLALKQSHTVIESLRSLREPYQYDLKKIVTKGDRILDVTLSKIGGKGLFVKEIEKAMFDGEIDMAVHSMKDMPAELPDGLVLACIPRRADPRDVLISKHHRPFFELPEGAVIGTSSLRRGAQVLAKRPDLAIEPIRGNIDTRLRKLEEGHFDAIILAAAGLQRMGWSHDVVTEFLDQDVCLPAVGQGALAIECRSDDEELLRLLDGLNDEETFRTVSAERAFLHRLEGSCQTPIAAYAELDNETIILKGLVTSPDGKVVFQGKKTGTDPVGIGRELAQDLLNQGANDILARVKEEME
ncbi:MAG TPA: hydroxymethylbilane synthase [Bacillales bacterium]|nr:hydroxymethylbilane synthase [Bacillales bacterium]